MEIALSVILVILFIFSAIGFIVTINHKNFYTSSEVEELCKKAMQQGEVNEGCTALYKSFDDWFEENKKK